MLVKLSIILFSDFHNFTYYAHIFYLLFSNYAQFNAHGIIDS